jgi:outer membrane murein-binding lipoprotein Lpp
MNVKEMQTYRVVSTAICVSTLLLAGCSVTSPVQSASTSKSAFEGAVYKGQTVTVNAGAPDNPTYRVFQQGATGFVSVSQGRCGAAGDRFLRPQG